MRKAGFVTAAIFLPRRMHDGSTFWLTAVAVLCGLGKYCFLARFQMADDTCLQKVRDNTGRLPWIEKNSRVHKLPVGRTPAERSTREGSLKGACCQQRSLTSHSS